MRVTSNGYKDKFSIDRIDNDKGYTPDNCRWVDQITQANNKRNTKKYEYLGKQKTIREWAIELQIDYKFLRGRIDGGFTIEEAVNTKFHHKRTKPNRGA